MEDLTTDSLGGANIGSLLDHLAYDKTDGGGGGMILQICLGS